MPKEVINPSTVAKPVGHYSQGVKARGSTLLFIAGQVALDENGNLVGKGDIEAQTRQIMRNIQRILEAAGGTMDTSSSSRSTTPMSTSTARCLARCETSSSAPTIPPGLASR